MEFLTDEVDTVANYEAQAKEVKRTSVDKGMGQMDRVKQVEAGVVRESGGGETQV